MALPFMLTWKCPHHPNGCEDGGKFSPRAVACRQDEVGWLALKEARNKVKTPLKKPHDAAKPSDPAFAWKDADFDKNWPHLASWLGETSWDDGTARETGTLLIFVQDGQLKCCLNDRALNRSVFLTTPTLALLLDACEAGLAEDNHHWREKKAYKG